MEKLTNDPPGQAPERVDFVRDLVLAGRSDEEIAQALGKSALAEAKAIRDHEDHSPEARAAGRTKLMEKAFLKLTRAVLAADASDMRQLVIGVNAVTRLNKAINDNDRIVTGDAGAPEDSSADDPHADDPDAEETQNGKFEYGTGALTKGAAGRAMEREDIIAELGRLLPGVETKSRPLHDAGGPAPALPEGYGHDAGGAFSRHGQTVPASSAGGGVADMADDGRARIGQDEGRR